MHTTATNTTALPESLLTPTEQAWLDACPVGDSRSLTSCGRTVTVDRRVLLGAPVQVPSFTIEPRLEIGLPGSPTYGTGTGDVVCTHPQHAPDRPFVWLPDIKKYYPIGPDIALHPTGGSYVQTTFRLSTETLTALA
jgi:hypothetical protein